ncbi:MAG: mechanosensitive ion channel family protein [Alphaproteobacteria bacterium]|nr:mechanosensitive ion channel family protein [Alphaproteobacteria bacterium]
MIRKGNGLVIFSAISVVGVLIFSEFLSNLVNLDHYTQLYQARHVLKSFLIITAAYLFIRLLKGAMAENYQKRHQAPIPKLWIDLISTVILVITVIFIISHVYGQEISTLITSASLLGAGMAFALQGFFLDGFSSIILDVERPFKIGDWIKTSSDIEGRVINLGWRHTTLLTLDDQIIIVPNGKLLSEPLINLSRPDSSYRQTVEVVIDHDVPVDRAQRILYAAACSAKGVCQRDCRVYAHQTKEGGVVYHIRYRIEDHEKHREVRHAVIESVTRQLHLMGLKISESLGEYCDVFYEKQSKESKTLSWTESESPPLTAFLYHVDIFASLSLEDLEQISKTAVKHFVRGGQTIVQQDDLGSSMFIVFEGLVEVILKTTQSDGTDHLETINVLHQGGYFGERALLLGENRVATVKAKSDAIVYEIKKESFGSILKKNPAIIHDIGNVIDKRDSQISEALSHTHESEHQSDEYLRTIIKGIKTFFNIRHDSTHHE